MQSDPDVYPPLLEILEETETVLRGSYIVNESQSRLSAVRDYPDPMPQVFPQTLGATNALEFVQGLMTVLAVKQLIHGAHSLEVRPIACAQRFMPALFFTLGEGARGGRQVIH